MIARTLGVIDDTKASTSEIQHELAVAASTANDPCAAPPAIHVQDESEADTADDTTPVSTPPPTYFNNPLEGEGNLKLSGVDMFSPAPSQPPSPTLSRKDLAAHMLHQVQPMSRIVDEPERDESGDITPGSEISSISVGSSFAFGGDSSSEDGVQVRKRRPVGEVDA